MFNSQNVLGLLGRLGGRVLATIALGTALCAMGTLTGCYNGQLTLQYQPTENNITAGTLKGMVYLAEVEDQRPNKPIVAENREKATPVESYWKGTSPAQFVHHVFMQELAKDGLQMATKPEGASRILTLTLTQFWVDEEDEYQAAVIIKARVQDKDGTMLWTGEIVGKSSTSGHSLSPANYNQVLSDATLLASTKLALSLEFATAVRP